MENTVEELKKIITFKDTTEVGDVVLMARETEEENMPLVMAYAVITDFERDSSKRDDWWFVHLAFLSIPPQPQVLILQESHYTGREIFTMGGKKVFIKALDFSKSEEPAPPEEKEKPRGGLRVVKG